MKKICLLLFFLIPVGCGTKKEISLHVPAGYTLSINKELSQRVLSHGFPRLANQIQLCCGGKQHRNLLDQVHYWDVITLDVEVVHYLRQDLGPDGSIRIKNPNAVLLAYFSAGDVNSHRNSFILSSFNKQIKDEWYLRDTTGQIVPLYKLPSSAWTLAQNPTTGINRFMPKFLLEHVLNGNKLDGLFYDWGAMTHMSWLNHRKPPQNGPVDIDQDGKKDSDAEVDRLWIQGMTRMLAYSRELFPQGSLIISNAGWNSDSRYSSVLNGIMIEQFLKGTKIDREKYGWGAVMSTYAHYQEKSVEPRVSIIMANDDGEKKFSKMRFALASTLLFDGYFCFTNEKNAYATTRWYDEYSVDLSSGIAVKTLDHKGYLGKPLGKAFRVDKPYELLVEQLVSSPSRTESKVWRRDFENGIVLVNPGRESRQTNLNGSYRKIKGAIDPSFNDGSTIQEITLGPREGAVLLREL